MVYVPKCMVIVSEQPFFELHKAFLGHIYRSVILRKVMNTKSAELVVSGDDYEEFRQLYMSYGLSKAEEIFDAEYIQARRKVKRRSDLRPPIVVKEAGLLEYYVSVTGLFESSSKLKVVEFVREKEEVMFHYITQHECFHPPDLNVLNIFRRMSLDTILQILKNLMLERQILVFAKRPQSIVELFESLFYFIKPYLWETTYLPFLPLHFSKVVDAIGGYVIGMSEANRDYILDSVSGKVFLFLEEDILLEQNQDPVEFPEPARKWLVSELEAAGITREPPAQLPNTQQAEMRQKKWLKTVTKVKQIFFNFLMGLLNNYRPFLTEDVGTMHRVEIDTEKYLSILPQ